MSIHIDENDDHTIKAFGCHNDLFQEDVSIEAEYEPGSPGDINTPPMPSYCEITALYIRVRRLDDPVKIDRCHFGENVIKAWEAQIIDEIEDE